MKCVGDCRSGHCLASALHGPGNSQHHICNASRMPFWFALPGSGLTLGFTHRSSKTSAGHVA
eukprot:12033243-Alexandrium_andersonii.AAC.1